MNKKGLQLYHPPTRSNPSKKETRLTANRLPHFGAPHHYTLMPLKTRYYTPFVFGGEEGGGITGEPSTPPPSSPRWTRGVSAQALLKLLQTRDWHHTGKISEVSVLLRGKRGGVKKQTSLFFVLEL